MLEKGRETCNKTNREEEIKFCMYVCVICSQRKALNMKMGNGCWPCFVWKSASSYTNLLTNSRVLKKDLGIHLCRILSDDQKSG